MSFQSNKPINRSKTTQISDPCNFNIDNLIFDEPIKTEVSGIPPYYRINLATKIDKSESELVFQMERCRMFGIKENRDMNTNNLTGYSAGMMMFDQLSPSERQMKTLETFQQIVEKCKDHLMQPDIKKKINKTAIKVREQLDTINPVSFMKNKETQEPDMNAPVLNAKLIYAKAKKDKDGNDIEGRMISRFYSEDDVDENGEPQVIDPLDFLNKKGSIIAAIRFESIFVGKDIKIQVKIYEAAIKTDDLSSGFKRLLRFGNVSNDTIININMESSVPESDSFQINTSDQISLDDEDDESSKKLKKKSKK
jgi:hypothetical protein